MTSPFATARLPVLATSTDTSTDWSGRMRVAERRGAEISKVV